MDNEWFERSLSVGYMVLGAYLNDINYIPFYYIALDVVEVHQLTSRFRLPRPSWMDAVETNECGSTGRLTYRWYWNKFMKRLLDTWKYYLHPQ